MKKNIIFKWALMSAAVLFAYSCTEPDDLVTDGAKSGGLLKPVAANMSFVGDPVTVSVATTEGVEEIAFYKTYTKGGVATDEVLDQTVSVSDGTASFTSDYAALKEGLTGLPDNASGLKVGDFWTFRLVSTLSDGREVQSATKIKVTVDNPYSGTYVSSGTRWNFNSAGDANISTMPPTGFVNSSAWTFDTGMTTVDETTCKVQCGNANGDFGTFNVKVNPDNSVEIIVTDDTGLANLVQLPGWPSIYEPATKKFTLHYQYTNDTGTHRVLRHYLVRK